MPEPDDLDRVVIEAADAWATAYDDRRADDGTILMTGVGKQLYDAVKARQRRSRVDVIRTVIRDRCSGASLAAKDLPSVIDEALTKWEQQA